jgi:hypothetical protein
LWNSITQRGSPQLAELAVIVGGIVASGAGGLMRSTCADAPEALDGSRMTELSPFHAATEPAP